jgi:hypothetical protein
MHLFAYIIFVYLFIYLFIYLVVLVYSTQEPEPP